MFASISFAGLSKSKLFGYAAELPFYSKLKKLDFEPGLTVLFGPNGCGKTSLLRMLGDTMCATQGGVSTVTESAAHDTVDAFGDKTTDSIGLKVQHDGQPVIFCDPRAAVGLVGGAFDDDFFEQGLSETMSRGISHGQKTAHRANTALAILSGHEAPPEEVRWKIKKSGVNGHWKNVLDIIEKRMTASIPRGQVTLLLDEPEANFSLVWQGRLWSLLARPDIAERFQVIVATHSVFSLGIPGAHYVEFEPGYVEAATAVFRAKAMTLMAAG